MSQFSLLPCIPYAGVIPCAYKAWRTHGRGRERCFVQFCSARPSLQISMAPRLQSHCTAALHRGCHEVWFLPLQLPLFPQSTQLSHSPYTPFSSVFMELCAAASTEHCRQDDTVRSVRASWCYARCWLAVLWLKHVSLGGRDRPVAVFQFLGAGLVLVAHWTLPAGPNSHEHQSCSHGPGRPHAWGWQQGTSAADCIVYCSAYHHQTPSRSKKGLCARNSAASRTAR